LNEIDKAAKRAADLTRQLLAFGSRQIMRITPSDLNTVVENLLRMLRRLIEEQVSIQTVYAPRELWVETDVVMLEQVVTNLALNARDAMPKGGQLTIRTDQVEIDPAYTQRHHEASMGQFARLSISDTGSGMDATMIRRIFEPFYTTKEVGRGTGLGLATAYGIIKQHRGWIEVESVVGRGSIFKVHLPLTSKRPSPKAPQDTAQGPQTPLSILLVEDDQAVRGLLARQLRDRGHRVKEAATALEALGLWAKHKAEIDLLISDMIMPGGMSGYELACQCREENPNLPVIIASGYSSKTNLSRPANEPGILYLPKPFDANTLAAVIQRGVRSASKKTDPEIRNSDDKIRDKSD
jgi:CheY-like chemotaxis protein